MQFPMVSLVPQCHSSLYEEYESNWREKFRTCQTAVQERSVTQQNESGDGVLMMKLLYIAFRKEQKLIPLTLSTNESIS
jgi:hypothetical protein